MADQDRSPNTAASDWTGDSPGRSNNSAGYLAIAREVERLIRGDAFKLMRREHVRSHKTEDARNAD